MKEQEIHRGFNKGYFLCTHAPELATQFQQVLLERKDEYAVGFLAGVQERERELIKSKTRHIMPSKRSNKGDKKRSRNRDKDIERDEI